MANDLDYISAGPVPNDQDSVNEDAFLFKAKKREEALKVVIHHITKITLIVVVMVLVIVFLIRVAHYIIPEHFKWLNDIQLQGLDKFFFNGALGGLMSKHVGKLFGNG